MLSRHVIALPFYLVFGVTVVDRLSASFPAWHEYGIPTGCIHKRAEHGTSPPNWMLSILRRVKLIPSVCWELYQVEHSSLDNTHGRKDDPTNNASSSKDTWDTCTKLLDVVRALRLNLRLAFFNALGLWIFQLVKPGQEPSASPSQDFSSLIQSAGLKCGFNLALVW